MGAGRSRPGRSPPSCEESAITVIPYNHSANNPGCRRFKIGNRRILHSEPATRLLPMGARETSRLPATYRGHERFNRVGTPIAGNDLGMNQLTISRFNELNQLDVYRGIPGAKQ
jgi:hypothetical protein